MTRTLPVGYSIRQYLAVCLAAFLFSDFFCKVLAGDKLECRSVDSKEWMSLAASWKGRELVGFASWCSSCREKILATKEAPDKYVFLSVFEDHEQSVRAMERLGLSSPCIRSEELVKKFGIRQLPWSTKL